MTCLPSTTTTTTTNCTTAANTTMNDSLEPPSKRCVMFSPLVDVQNTLHINSDYSEDELKACWYSAMDFKIIRHDNRTTVAMIEDDHDQHQHQLDDIHYCRRGLEHKTKVNRQARYMTRMQAMEAVLEEQDLQEEEGTENGDDELISMVYMEHAYSSQANAHLLGLEDQIYAAKQNLLVVEEQEAQERKEREQATALVFTVTTSLTTNNSNRSNSNSNINIKDIMSKLLSKSTTTTRHPQPLLLASRLRLLPRKLFSSAA